jgi:hypothetical protein
MEEQGCIVEINKHVSQECVDYSIQTFGTTSARAKLVVTTQHV